MNHTDKFDGKAPPTVENVIKILNELPKDLICHFRPKYHGDMSCFDEIPLNMHGIAILEDENGEDRVTFLT